MAFDELTPEHWDRIIAINLTGPFNVLWAVKSGMIAQKFGRIVNVSSIAALAVRPDQLPYAAAKAGVISLTKSCCGPLAQHNIRINSVAPGAIATDMLSEVSEEMVEQLRSTTPLGRLGEPYEMADVIAFLLSEESSYMTGSTVIASGGRILIRKHKFCFSNFQIKRNERLFVLTEKRISLKIAPRMNLAQVPSINLDTTYRCINS